MERLQINMSSLNTLPLARGDALYNPASRLASPLPSVSNEAWTKFVSLLEVQPLHGVSASNALGCYAMRPRRLQDLGVMTRLRYTRRQDNHRQVWEGDFLPPLTQKLFLSNPVLQYHLLVKSVRLHQDAVSHLGLPSGLTHSGRLALLHRGGKGALLSWGKTSFPETVRFVQKLNGVF